MIEFIPRRLLGQMHILTWTDWLKILALPVGLLALLLSIPLFSMFFVPGEEPFMALLRDPNHLMFEAVTGIAQTLVVDVFLLAVAWPFVKRHIHQDVQDGVECPHEDNHPYLSGHGIKHG